jgi:hypothetical protein
MLAVAEDSLVSPIFWQQQEVVWVFCPILAKAGDSLGYLPFQQQQEIVYIFCHILATSIFPHILTIIPLLS